MPGNIKKVTCCKSGSFQVSYKNNQVTSSTLGYSKDARRSNRCGGGGKSIIPHIIITKAPSCNVSDVSHAVSIATLSLASFKCTIVRQGSRPRNSLLRGPAAGAVLKSHSKVRGLWVDIPPSGLHGEDAGRVTMQWRLHESCNILAACPQTGVNIQSTRGMSRTSE